MWEINLGKLLKELESVLERYIEHEAIGEDLDHVTTSLMVHDDYEKLPEELQETIEHLDTWETQHFTRDDLERALKTVRSFLEQ
jgi:hypothetical protein